MRDASKVPRTVLPLILPLLVPLATAGAQVTGRSTVRGRITDTAGRGLAGAMVIRPGIRPDTLRADSGGHYVLSGLARGRHVLQVARPGYQTIEMDLTLPGDTALEVDVPLEAVSAAALTARGGVLDSVGFLRRRAESQGRRGIVFLGPEELAAREGRVTQLFQGMTDLRVQSQGSGAVVLGDAGRCAMKFLIDGFPARLSAPLDDVVRLEELAAVEVYPRSSQTPREFDAALQTAVTGRRFETRTDECGVILLWRK